MEQRDLPQAFRLLGEMNANVFQVNQLVDDMLTKVKNGEVSTDKGLSFLEMKYHMLLSYLINLTYVVLRKCSGERIEGDPSIDRLVEIRTVLEKIRPIDQKLKYQIDKLVKTTVTGTSANNDPSNFKANPDALMPKLDGADEDSDSEEDDDDPANKSKQSRKSGVYVPPKLAAVHYGEQNFQIYISRLEQDDFFASISTRNKIAKIVLNCKHFFCLKIKRKTKFSKISTKFR